MQFSNGGYYSAMDNFGKGQVTNPLEPVPLDDRGDPVVSDDDLNFTIKDLGTTTNPMGNTLDSLKSRIREGTSKIEFSFMGQHKGNSQNPTPESFGSLERQDMRELAKINEMKTSTHAAVHANALSGFTQRGFNDEARGDVINEIKKAIQFAGEATRGGAIVFHIHEWQRPLTHLKDKSGAKFSAYDEEDKDAVLFAVDKRTGEAISSISKNRQIFRPVYITAQDQGLAGKKDRNGNLLEADDWIDLRGNKIPRDAETERLFDRVPKFNKEKTNFEVQQLDWQKLEEETEKYNKQHPNDQKRPEEVFARLEIENRVLQAKGASLFHAQQYEDRKKSRDKLLEEYETYKKLKESLPEEEKWKLNQWNSSYVRKEPDETYDEAYKHAIKGQEDSMRHTHESSSSADVQAKQAEAIMDNIESAEKYGLRKAADTIAKSAVYAMQTYEKNKDKYGLKEELYVAPENWNTKHYGSHPDEYKKVIEESRKKMVDLLMSTQGKSKKEAEDLSKKHIKGTLDIGHLNTFREFYKNQKGEVDPKGFEKWMLDQAEDLVKNGYVGHIHMSDNFGFDDEHITPGQGNVPVKEFLKRMQKLDMRDITIETGSFNISTAVPDTLSYINSPIYGTGSRMRFNNVRNQQFGYNAPGFFIAGSYSPSNDWKPWTDIPLE
ncbi:MAG: TIM barrel protein [Candidatus Nanoarchaeia archaeon]